MLNGEYLFWLLMMAPSSNTCTTSNRPSAGLRSACLAVGVDEIGIVLDAELIPEPDAVAAAQIDVGAALVLADHPGGDRGATELGHQILHRLLQLVVDLLTVARLPELAAAAAYLIPLGEGPVGPAWYSLRPSRLPLMPSNR